MGAGPLPEAALTRQYLQAAWKRVKANKGTAGVDGLDIEQTARMLQTRWPEVRQALLEGRYRPSPVRKVMIPKPDGSQHELGILTMTDRLIQQALLQVLQPLIDPTFSDHSHGFRPGRRADDAAKAARADMQSGKRVVVDVDMAKFFDRVNHDILIDRLNGCIGKVGLIRLIREYRNASIMDGAASRCLCATASPPCSRRVTLEATALAGDKGPASNELLTRCKCHIRGLARRRRSHLVAQPPRDLQTYPGPSPT